MVYCTFGRIPPSCSSTKCLSRLNLLRFESLPLVETAGTLFELTRTGLTANAQCGRRGAGAGASHRGRSDCKGENSFFCGRARWQIYSAATVPDRPQRDGATMPVESITASVSNSSSSTLVGRWRKNDQCAWQRISNLSRPLNYFVRPARSSNIGRSHNQVVFHVVPPRHRILVRLCYGAHQ